MVGAAVSGGRPRVRRERKRERKREREKERERESGGRFNAVAAARGGCVAATAQRTLRFIVETSSMTPSSPVRQAVAMGPSPSTAML
jgi:hypothetical protein